MSTLRNEYTKEWNNESLVEHNLTYHSSDTRRRSIGNVDFRSPSRTLIEQETDSRDKQAAIWEDAVECAHKLDFLLLARAASRPTGIHRANSNASLKIFCAVQHYCKGESLRKVGNMIGKHHAYAERYINRFRSWSAANYSAPTEEVSPEKIIQLCKADTCENSLAENLDILRRELTDLFLDLLEIAGDSENASTEVYLQLDRFRREHNTFDIPKLIAAL